MLGRFAFSRNIPVALLSLLAFVALILSITAWQRGAEYDEGYTVALTAGTPRPDWPSVAFRAGDVRGVLDGYSSPWRIASDLRQTDVHPPLYFWAAEGWRQLVGPDLFALRLLSVLFGLTALVITGGLARIGRVPPLAAMLLTAGCYGFSYTAVVARGFALAQALTLAGVLLLMLTERRPRFTGGLAGGLLLGLATFSNYLAVFVAAAALLWLLLRTWRQPATWLAPVLGFALVLPADLWFFLAQRGSRAGQFPPFKLLPSIERLAQYAAGDVFGGLPLYVTGMAQMAVGAALALLLAAIVLLIAARWRRIGAPSARLLFAMAAVAPPVGLILLGLAFDNTPIELRYLAFATPFFGLLAAGALASLPPRPRRVLTATVLVVQAASLAGLILMPQTMQPQRAVTRQVADLAGPLGLVLLPRGNDGIGVVAAVVQEAPDWLRLLVIPRGLPAQQIRDRAGAVPRVVLARLGVDEDSRATLVEIAAAFRDQPCWRATHDDDAALAFARNPACGPTAKL